MLSILIFISLTCKINSLVKYQIDLKSFKLNIHTFFLHQVRMCRMRYILILAKSDKIILNFIFN